MHTGNIDNPETAAGRVYNVLKGHYGEWLGGWELTQYAQTTAVSTRISEIRAQLTLDPDRREKVEMKRDGRYFYYRIAGTESQMELFTT